MVEMQFCEVNTLQIILQDLPIEDVKEFLTVCSLHSLKENIVLVAIQTLKKRLPKYEFAEYLLKTIVIAVLLGTRVSIVEEMCDNLFILDLCS